ncbi:MAG: bifunctional diguanylate cyclase/phosphodiesterase [Chitinophagaceae bacterium]|nr:bifunctional diguanylate cyclase/phosphodiesterase [Rubrivivax sp.]
MLLTLAMGMLFLRQHRRGAQLSDSLRSVTTQLDTMRSRDSLTGLVTRAGLEAALDDAVRAADAGGSVLSLLYVALDNFRPVNEGYGMRVGDALLVQAATRLSACVGHGARASRVGGDEFLLLVDGGLDRACELAEQVLRSVQRPFDVEGEVHSLTASIGVAVYPEHGSRPKLIGNAALAMRSVKLGGGGVHAHFDPSMAVDLRDQAELLHDLRSAVERGQLQLYYQPKIDARSLQITGAEALLRWQHPRRGMVSPAVFVPLAERHGLIRRIGAWVIEEACRQAAQWREQDLRMRVAVNISGHQMRQDDLVELILQSTRRHDIRPERLTVEITESVAMEDTAHTRATFDRLRQAGLHVSIDDFGTGHSSLAALRKLPAAELKIDRAFVTDLATSADARSIALAIVQMAHSLELRVVAEGVENDAQRDLLMAMGCDELQGYLFAKPMTASSLALWAEDDASAGDAFFRPSLFGSTLPAPLDK